MLGSIVVEVAAVSRRDIFALCFQCVCTMQKVYQARIRFVDGFFAVAVDCAFVESLVKQADSFEFLWSTMAQVASRLDMISQRYSQNVRTWMLDSTSPLWLMSAQPLLFIWECSSSLRLMSGFVKASFHFGFTRRCSIACFMHGVSRSSHQLAAVALYTHYFSHAISLCFILVCCDVWQHQVSSTHVCLYISKFCVARALYNLLPHGWHLHHRPRNVCWRNSTDKSSTTLICAEECLLLWFSALM